MVRIMVRDLCFVRRHRELYNLSPLKVINIYSLKHVYLHFNDMHCFIVTNKDVNCQSYKTLSLAP